MLRYSFLRILIGLMLIIHSSWAIADSKWQLPLSGLDPSFVQLDRAWAKKADFLLAWPKSSRLLVPQEGTLVFMGATGSLGAHRYGWIIRHSKNRYSVLTTSMPLNLFETQVPIGSSLRSGDVLASRSVRFPAQADLRLHWKILRTSDVEIASEVFSLEHLIGSTEVGFSNLLKMGSIEFDVDNPMLTSEVDVDVGSQRISGRDITAHRFLIPQGTHRLAVVWGGFFKKSSDAIKVYVGGDGLLVHQLQRDPKGQWNALAYDYHLPEGELQAAARINENDETESRIDPATKKMIDWLAKTPDASEGVTSRTDIGDAVQPNVTNVSGASIPGSVTTPAQVALNVVEPTRQDRERAAEPQSSLLTNRQDETRPTEQQVQELQAQKVRLEILERERLVSEAVEIERKKRVEIELKLAAAEARELERQLLEKKEKEQEKERLNAVPKVFASRKALVIGNDQYVDVPKLNNAVADADAMASALQAVGFNVFKHINVDEKRFKLALRDFRMRLEPGDEVMVFFAGHGVQLNNANYLLPVDIKGENEEQIRDEAIQLQRVLDDLQDRRAKFALAVVDACRDNPFKGNGRAIGGRGLAPTTAATGQMILFSAGAGQQALDRLGKEDKERNGLFTRIFVKEMVKPGVSVDRVLRNVRNEVVRLAKTIGHDQTPALYDQAVGDFYFRQ